MIERWTNPNGSTDHVWSLWRDGRRVRIGNRHPAAEPAETEATEFCEASLGQAPDRVVRL